MSRDKQIEEIEGIKKVLVRTCKRARNMQEDYMQDRYAEALYKAGYRKASDVAKEIFEELKELGIVTKVHYDGKIIYDCADGFAELKKKHTEER